MTVGISNRQKGLELRRLLALFMELGMMTEEALLGAYIRRWPEANTISPVRLAKIVDSMDRQDWIHAWRHHDVGKCRVCRKTITERTPREELEWAVTFGHSREVIELFEALQLVDTLGERGDDGE